MKDREIVEQREWRGINPFIPILLIVSVAILGGCGGDPLELDPALINPEHVRNFHAVTPGKVYRSGRITPEGFEYLFEHGLQSVINLRSGHDDSDLIPEDHLDFYYRVRVPAGHHPTEEQMMEILDIVCDPDNQPVLIHCAAGEFRTGVVVAVIRYSIDGWPMEKALIEAEKYNDGEPLAQPGLLFAMRWQKKHQPGDYNCNWGRTSLNYNK